MTIAVNWTLRIKQKQIKHVFQFCFRAMSSQANKEQFLKQFEQIVEGVEQNKGKVIFHKIERIRLLNLYYKVLNF